MKDRVKALHQTDNVDSDLFWALKDINFEVEQGEVVGIIGRNGAGKSTLLKILSRITPPTTGEVRYRGRIASLLEVGTGFHGELTGRENIFLNGEILGMRHAEVHRKLDEIVAFSEVEEFLDTPVKFYSSGMYIRLAFAVAAHLDTDIMIVDEVLAVGDASFQRKCLGKMDAVSKSGRTVLFVSHNMGAISTLCTRGILLDKGKIIVDCDIQSVIGEYSNNLRLQNGKETQIQFEMNHVLDAFFTEVKLTNAKGAQCINFDLNDEITIQLKYHVRRLLKDLKVTIYLSRNMIEVFGTSNTDDMDIVLDTAPGEYVVKHVIPSRFLKAGVYTITMGIGTPYQCYQLLVDRVSFEIEELIEDSYNKEYRKDRLGHVISQGKWSQVIN